MRRSSARRTEQQKALDEFSQLWISADEWSGPFEVRDLGDGGSPGRVIAWIFDRTK